MISGIYNNSATAASDTTPSYESIAEAKISEFLGEHGEIEMILPVVLGLAITSRFQLRGAQALLANLLVASVTRQILFKLKHPEAEVTESADATAPTPAPAPADDWGGEYQVVHSIPGRVRLKIPQLGVDPAFAKRLLKILNDDEHVITARINPSAMSLVIHYEPGELSDWQLGLQLMNLIKEAQTKVSA